MADTVDTAIYKMSYDTGNSVAQLNQTRAAAEGLVATTEKVDRVTRTSSAGFDRMIGRYDGLARAQQTYERELSKLARYEAEGIGTAAQHATIRGKVEAAYNAETFAARAAAGQLTATERATKSLGVVTGDLQGRMQGAVGSIGLLGQTLSALGSGGIAVAAGIGAVTLAFIAADAAAHGLAQKAIGLRDFAASTGLTTSQVQGLEKAAAKLGIDNESLEASLQKGSIAFEELRNGGGKVLDLLRRYKPELVEQIASTENYAEAVTLLGSAFEGLTVSQQNALGKSFFGKGSIETLRLFKGIDVAKRGADFDASGRGLDPGQVQRLAELKTQVDESSKKLREGFSKLFAEDLLRGELTFYNGLNDIVKVVKEFKLAPDWLTLQTILRSPIPGSGINAYVTQQAARLGGPLKNALETSAQGAIAGGEYGDLGPGGIENQVQPKRTTGVGSDYAATAPTLPKEKGELTPKFQVEALQAAAAALGAASTASEQYELHIKQLNIALTEGKISQEQLNRAVEQLGSSDAAERATQVQLSLAREATAEADRHSAAVLKIAESYKGVSVSTALVLAAQKDQLAIAESVTGAERLRATEVAKTNELLLAGKSAEDASKIAAGERANAQAQINTQAKQQVISLHEQLALANTVTGQDQMRIQYQITLNKLLRDGVDSILAQEAASLELAVAQANVNKSVEQQTKSLKQQTEMIYAQANGTEAAVASAQAYKNAIDQGASSTQAAALATATMDNYMAKAAVEAERLEKSMENTAKAAATVRVNGQNVSATGSSMGMSTVAGTGGGTITGSVSHGSINVNADTSGTLAAMANGQSGFNWTKAGMMIGSGMFTSFDQQVSDASSRYGAFANRNPSYLTQLSQDPAYQDQSTALGQGFHSALESMWQKQDPVFANDVAKALVGGQAPLNILNQILTGQIGANASPNARFEAELDLEKRAGVTSAQILDDIKSGKIGKGADPTVLLRAIDELTEAIKSNTSAISLSPFYTQQGDHLLGYRGYSNNGVGIAAVPTATTTGQTPLPAPTPTTTATGTTSGSSRYIYSSDPNMDTRARHFATGGIAYSPTNASIAENEPEAVVPLAGGSIPVKIVGNAKNDNQAPIYITQNFFAPAERDDIRQTSYQAISEARRALGAR